MSRLHEIKSRAAAATEGPWEWTQYRVPTLEGWKGDPAAYRWQTEVLEADHNGECGCRSACQLELTVDPADAEFIAHARTDIPALVAAVEAVLELRTIANTYRTLDEWEEGYNAALDQAKHKIRTALGGESDS